jgi:hypothetical protein
MRAMSETAIQRAQRVADQQLGTLSFKRIEFNESMDAEVVRNGGAMTTDMKISFDPRYALRLPYSVLAFVMAHERWHALFESSLDEKRLRLDCIVDAMLASGFADAQKTPPEKLYESLYDVAGRYLRREGEWDADDYAIRVLFDDCGWPLEVVKNTLMEWRANQEWYANEIVQNPDFVEDIREENKRQLRRCQEIWDERRMNLP